MSNDKTWVVRGNSMDGAVFSSSEEGSWDIGLQDDTPRYSENDARRLAKNRQDAINAMNQYLTDYGTGIYNVRAYNLEGTKHCPYHERGLACNNAGSDGVCHCNG